MRVPLVAGQFYPGNKEDLSDQLDIIMPAGKEKKKVTGIMSPHAGYVFSGAVAGEVFSCIVPAETYIILGPNHTGKGAGIAVSTEIWSTPIGEVKADEDFIGSIMSKTDIIEEDARAHAMEHSIEVQIPFIQKISPDARIVPISVRSGNVKECEELAGILAGAIRDTSKTVVIVASTDMTHYESRKTAEQKDMMAIDAVLSVDGPKLLEVVRQNDISMCGVIPTAIMLMTAEKMGSEKAELIKYTDSGEITGDISEVVGYAGVLVY